jgi:hypothetical protein
VTSVLKRNFLFTRGIALPDTPSIARRSDSLEETLVGRRIRENCVDWGNPWTRHMKATRRVFPQCQLGMGVARAMDFTHAALVHRYVPVLFLAHRIANELRPFAGRFRHFQKPDPKARCRGDECGVCRILELFEG